MSSINDFVIENGVLKSYSGEGGDIEIPTSVERIAREAFQLCKTIQAVRIPQNVKEIDDAAFRGSSLTQVELPEGIALGCSAFEACKNLREIRLPEGIEGLPFSIFSYCTGLETVIFPKSLPFIDNMVFQNCTALRCVELPENLEEIGQQCFDRCQNLEKVVLPDALQTIGGGAFARCENLKEIDCSDRVFRLFLDSCNAKTLPVMIYKYLSGALVTEAKPDDQLAKYIKKNIMKLFPMILEDDMAAALETAVSICGEIDKKNLNAMVKSAAEAENAPSVTAWLLQYQAQTTDPVQAAKEENDALEKALGLKKMTAADWKKLYAVKSIDAEQVQLGQYSGTDTAVAVPDMIGKKKVTSLNGTFCRYAQLQQVQLPDTVLEIIRSTFDGCTQLTGIILPKKLKTLGGGTFRNCSGLEKIELPKSVSVLGMSAFENCTALKEVILSPKIKTIPITAFAGCAALTGITIPEKCREIESFAFDRCFNLEAVHIGAGVKSIDYEAFDDCPKLTIFAPAGSYAETWANQHNIPFVAE